MTFKLCKLLSILFCIAFLVFACTVNSAAGGLLGDSDCDGTVTLFDATCIQSSLAGLRVECFSEMSADVDGNNAIEITDATYIQRYLVGIETPYSIGTQIGAPTEAPTQSPTDPEGWGYIIYRP